MTLTNQERELQTLRAVVSMQSEALRVARAFLDPLAASLPQLTPATTLHMDLGRARDVVATALLVDTSPVALQDAAGTPPPPAADRGTPLQLWHNGSDLYVAHSADDVRVLSLYQVGALHPEERDGDGWRALPGDAPIEVGEDDGGAPVRKHTRSAADWCAQAGRGFLASSEF